ncbi:HNH endonuclease domain-containing protein [Alloiococcus sp. CFN-8]|uniref:HNH endonuclease domain-containing protein n=1 Tax=Alloiococcus sp. CFN-8 TaxID=3416081 RepID=UPI003CE79B3F
MNEEFFNGTMIKSIDLLPKDGRAEAGYLEAMLDNFAASYKLFWFKGIFTEVLKGNRTLSYKRIVARMIASAWYPIVFYNLYFGHSDNLADVISYTHNVLKVEREIDEEKLVEFICECEDKELNKKINTFTNFVPYRLIRPFYQRDIEEEKKNDTRFNDGKINKIIEQNNQGDENAFYTLDRVNKRLVVSKKWSEYLIKNAAIIEGWMNYKLIGFIQSKNPNVPAIPYKIFPPRKRDLSSATKYWTRVRGVVTLRDLYTDLEFTGDNLERYGSISIDHFIPWSFVLHDELWNLYPAFKNINSMKGNKLPDVKKYLDSFCQYHYRSFIAAKETKDIKKKTIEDYLTVRKDIFNIGSDDRGQDAFITSMKQTIEPLYQIASNQGYGVWWYR